MNKLFKLALIPLLSLNTFAEPAYTATNQNLVGNNIVMITGDVNTPINGPLPNQTNVSIGSVAGEVATQAGVFFRLRGTHMADTSSLDRSDFNDITSVGDQAAVYLGKFHPLNIMSLAQNGQSVAYDQSCKFLKGKYVGGAYVMSEGDNPQSPQVLATLNGISTNVYDFAGSNETFPMRQGWGCKYIDGGSDVLVRTRFMSSLIIDQYSGPTAQIKVVLDSGNGESFSKGTRIVNMKQGRWGALAETDAPISDADFFTLSPTGENASGITEYVTISDAENEDYIQMIFEIEYSLNELIEMTQNSAGFEDVYASAVTEYSVVWNYDNI